MIFIPPTAVPWINPADNGAQANGISDDSQALQDSIDQASENGGMVMLFPGTYRTTRSLLGTKSNVQIMGVGQASRILADGDFGDILAFDPGVVPTTLDQGLQGIRLLDFSIDTTVLRTNGAAVRVAWSEFTFTERLRLGKASASDALLHDGIRMEQQSNCNIIGCHIASIHYGTYFSGRTLAGQMPFFGCQGFMRRTNCWGKEWVQNSVGTYIAGGNGGLTIDNTCNLSHYDFGTLVQNEGEDGLDRNRELFLAPFNDGNSNCGLYVKRFGVDTLKIQPGWGAACGIFGVSWPTFGNGIRIDDEFAGTVDITGGQYDSNNLDNIYVGGGSATMGTVRATTVDVSQFVSDISIVGGWINPGGLTIDPSVPLVRVVGVTNQTDR